MFQQPKDADSGKDLTIRRVRSLLMLASRKGQATSQTPKERIQKETEFFKKLFMTCDRDSSGTLTIDEIITMARKHLKIAGRLVSDDQLRDFFDAIDEDGGGQLEFNEFLAFIRTKERNSNLFVIVLTQVKRVVRLAMHRKNLTLEGLEYLFKHAREEGIIETAGGECILGPEEMRRFFRKVLDVSTHEAPDRNLLLAFKAMDEDGGGTLDVEEFMDFIRGAMQEETTLSPCSKRRADDGIAGLVAGMRGALPARLPKGRPGTTFEGGVSGYPFCTAGRLLDPAGRLGADQAAPLKQASHVLPRQMTQAVSTLMASGLPKAAFMAAAAASAPPSRRSRSCPMLLAGCGAGAAEPAGAGETSLPPISPIAGSRAAACGQEAAERGLYSPVKGMLSRRDAAMLNRIETRMFEAGVDLRGSFHRNA